MIEKDNVRTDLALEEQEKFASDQVEIPGVILDKTYDAKQEIRVTTVQIETEKGARIMGKPVGSYITIEAPNMAMEDEGYHKEVSEKIVYYLEAMLKNNKRNIYSILVVGLGNRQITPDALGPYVVENLDITRHMIREFGKYGSKHPGAKLISALVPGVMGQTGMETVEIVRGVVEETRPDAVIAIDALAARSSKRLNRTIQIADTGIYPGSGVGNHRNALNMDTIGIPVIGIGVPTVVDAATIVNDAMEDLVAALETSETMRGVGLVMQGYSNAEKYQLIQKMISPGLKGMFVTPKDIDETVKRISYTISEALNHLFYA